MVQDKKKNAKPNKLQSIVYHVATIYKFANLLFILLYILF